MPDVGGINWIYLRRELNVQYSSGLRSPCLVLGWIPNQPHEMNLKHPTGSHKKSAITRKKKKTYFHHCLFWPWSIRKKVTHELSMISYYFLTPLVEQRIWYHLGLKVGPQILTQQLIVELVPSSHSEPPLVLQLSAEVKVHVRDQEPISVAWERWSAWSIGRWEVAWPIEVPKVRMLWLPIARSERVWEGLCPNPIYRPNKVAVCNRSISCLYN